MQENYTAGQVILPLTVNYFASVSIVLVNKTITKQWPFGYTLTCIHFLTTFLVLALSCLFRLFNYKHLSIIHVGELSLMFSLSIVLNNLSLQYNAVCDSFRQTGNFTICR